MEKNLLIVDNDEGMLRLFSELLKSQGSLLNVLTASSTDDAFEMVHKFKIDLVITAIRAPNVDGFLLVASLAKQLPDARIIVMTEESQQIIRARIKSIDSVVLMDQMYDIRMLTRRVFTELHIEYGGHVRGINISSFLQMMELEYCTCCLRIEAKREIGYLWLENGKLIAAKAEKSNGEDAALDIIAWKNVYIDIDYTPFTIDANVSTPLMRLLLESEQRYDEQLGKGKNKRSHIRHDMLVAIDYDINNMTRHCALRDVSLGGAYIETDHKLELGQTITLVLSSPATNSFCSIEAEVVRTDACGAGFKFKIDNPRQRQVVKAMIDASLQLAHA
jgi:CheY-like chemotaxis protein